MFLVFAPHSDGCATPTAATMYDIGVGVGPSTMESLGAYLFVGAFRYLASASWRLLAVTLDMINRRFPPPWTIERLPGGFKVIDADGQPLAYFYARENDNDAGTGGVLTMDEARRLASNFAKELP